MLDPFQQAPTFEDPLGMLQACHRRIERALDVLDRVAELEAVGDLDERAREALRRMLHYFAEGVPRHSADEDESLFPRLHAELVRAGTTSPEMVAALTAEHEEMDAAHRELDVLGQELLRQGRFADADVRARFQSLLHQLRRLYVAHIELEDCVVFPAAARLIDAEGLREVGAEMAARRGLDWEHQRNVLEQINSRLFSRSDLS